MAARPAKKIHVKTIAGEEVTLQLERDSFDRPVAELVKAACLEIGLPDLIHKDFSFATVTSNRQISLFKRKRKVWKASNDGSKLLNPIKSLKAQGIKEAETLTLTLRRRLFFAETTRCSHDAGKELDLTYLQLKNAICGATGVYSCAVSCDIAIKLAALQCYTEDVNIDGNFIEDKLNSLLPYKYTKVKGIASTVLDVYNSLDQELKNDSNEAKLRYIQLCTTLDGFGIILFSGKEFFKSTKKLIITKQKLVKCYLGITRDSVWRIEANSYEVLEKWPIASIKSWSKNRSNNLVALNDDNKSYVFCPSGECDAIIQLLHDYTSTASESESVNCSSPISCENASVARASGDSPSSENSPTETEIRETDSGTLSTRQGSATDPSSENPPGTEGGIRSTEADTNTPNGSVARPVSSANPINDSETNSAPAGISKNRDSMRSETGESSEEESPIHIRGHLTLSKIRSVKNRIWAARCKWYDLGIELKLDITDLDAISKKHGSDTDACLTEMLTMWLKQTEPRPKWSTMIKALKREPIGFQQLAEDIEKNSGTKQHDKSLKLLPKGMIESDEESQEGPHLEGRLRAQTRGIIVEFNILKCKLFDTLERHSVPKLTEYLEDYHAENLTSFDDVKKFIKQKSSFYDYEIINHIIGVAGTEGDKERLNQYKKQFEAYAKHQFRTPSTSPTTSVSQISFKLDSEYRKLQGDDAKLMQFQHRLCNLLKLPRSTPVCMEWLKVN